MHYSLQINGSFDELDRLIKMMEGLDKDPPPPLAIAKKVPAKKAEPEAKAGEVIAAPSEPTSAANQPDYNTVSKVVVQLINTKGKDFAQGVLREFGGDRLPAIDPSRFGDVMAACEKELAA